MTNAQAAAKAKIELPAYRCEAKLGKDRCTLGARHTRPHQTVGPTGGVLKWTVTSEPPLRRRPK